MVYIHSRRVVPRRTPEVSHTHHISQQKMPKIKENLLISSEKGENDMKRWGQSWSSSTKVVFWEAVWSRDVVTHLPPQNNGKITWKKPLIKHPSQKNKKNKGDCDAVGPYIQTEIQNNRWRISGKEMRRWVCSKEGYQKRLAERVWYVKSLLHSSCSKVA